MSTTTSRVYGFGPFRLDVAGRRLLRDGQPVPLTAKVFDILHLLVSKSGRLVEKDELMREVWPDSYVEENNLTVNIAALRKALGCGRNGQQYIETVPKRGYRFIAHVTELPPESAQAALSSSAPVNERATNENLDTHAIEAGVAVAPTAQSPSRTHTRIIALALVVLMLVLAGAGYGLYRTLRRAKSTRAFEKTKLTRLTTSGRVFGDAAISPDGKYVVYVLRHNGQHSIWLEHVATGSEVEIVPDADVFYSGPVVSRDGNHIYYLSCGPNADCALYKVAMLGGASYKLMDDVASPVAFSPDGSQMAFVRRDETGDAESTVLMLANADGSNARPLARHTEHDAFSYKAAPSWSPDGKLIACPMAVTDNAGSHMRVTGVAVADGTEKTLTPQNWRYIGQAAWLPDGSGLVLNGRDEDSSRDAPTQLWRVAYPSGAADKVTNDLNGHNGVCLTANADALVTVQTDTLSSIWLAQGDGASQTAVQLPSQTGARRNGYDGLSWTPDGRIVYASDAGGNLNLWVMNADGTNPKKLTDDAFENISPAVTPDGRYIVFQSDRAGGHSLWRMDIDGGNLKQLTPGPGDAWEQITPDGKWVFYTAEMSGKNSLWRVSIDGGAPARLTELSSYVPAISPDGKMIAYLMDDPVSKNVKIAMAPSEGGAPVKTFDAPPPPGGGWRIRWTPDGNSIAYAARRNGQNNLWSQPLDGGAAKQLTDFKTDSIFWFEWSLDGKQLALSRGANSNDVVLINNLK